MLSGPMFRGVLELPTSFFHIKLGTYYAVANGLGLSSKPFLIFLGHLSLGLKSKKPNGSGQTQVLVTASKR